MDEKPRPWFGLRDVLWLVVLAAVLAAWGFDHGRQARELERLSPPPTPATPIPLTPGGTGAFY